MIFKVKFIVILFWVSLLIWWVSKAVLRYWSQPLSTEISYSFGDNKNGIQFPLITLCEGHFSQNNPILSKCENAAKNFMQSVHNCMKNYKDFRISDLMNIITIKKNDVVFETKLWTGSKYDTLDDSIWSEVFHNLFGHCFTADLSRMDKFEFVSYEADSKPFILILLNNSKPWKEIKVILHSKFDLPDGATFNEATFVPISNDTSNLHKIVIRKKISIRESTRSMPCTLYEEKTCQNIEDNKLILTNFNCQIPILYHGHHLDHIIAKDVPECSHEETKSAFDLISAKTTKCTIQKTCNMTRYTSGYQIQEWGANNETGISIVFGTPEVERHNTYINYDLLSLVGEVGGILGLTLGLSGLSMTESMFQYIPYY